MHCRDIHNRTEPADQNNWSSLLQIYNEVIILFILELLIPAGCPSPCWYKGRGELAMVVMKYNKFHKKDNTCPIYSCRSYSWVIDWRAHNSIQNLLFLRSEMRSSLDIELGSKVCSWKVGCWLEGNEGVLSVVSCMDYLNRNVWDLTSGYQVWDVSIYLGHLLQVCQEIINKNNFSDTFLLFQDNTTISYVDRDETKYLKLESDRIFFQSVSMFKNSFSIVLRSFLNWCYWSSVAG